MEGTELITNILRNIVSEVYRECKNHKIIVSTDFINFVVYLFRLDPNRGLNEENLTKRDKVQKFIKLLVSQFRNKNDPQTITLRLQYEFDAYFKNLEKSVIFFRKKLKKKLYPLLMEIIEQNPENDEELLYKKITIYVTLASGLGNPTDRAVFKEAIQVMRSILEPEEIELFPNLQPYIKQELVQCLVYITTGIRLYNKECRKGGEGIPDLPNLLKTGIEAVKFKLQQCIELAVYRARLVTRYVERHMCIRSTKDEYVVDLDFDTPEEKVKWAYMRDWAATYRQLSKTTRVLLEYITKLDENRKQLYEKYTDTIKYLHKIIVPTLYQAIAMVFPHFSDLAKIWKEFQDDAIRLKKIYTLHELQSEQTFSMKFSSKELDSEPDYMERWIKTEDEELLENVPTADVIVHTDTRRFTKKDLAFHGYCCWILTQTRGTLMPGEISLGVVEYKKKFYAFSSRMSANSFIKSPNKYFFTIL